MRSAGVPVRAIGVECVDGPDAGARVSAVGADPLRVGSSAGNDLVLRDPTVSRFHLELRRKGDRILVIDLGSTNGTEIGPALLHGGSASVAGGALCRIGGTTLRVTDGGVEMIAVEGPDSLGELRGRSPAMRRVMAAVQKLAHAAVPVLILGESGTGKELVARALHAEGARADGPFETVDCSALAPTLLASELFGHERGAFTGADRTHVGAFERAHGGTLFLDEIGELPAAAQASLLGALERRRFRRVGGREEIAVDVRVVAATHRDLRAEVNAGSFRLDLYYRLAVVLLELPPLRERPEDVALLVEHFARAAGYDGPLDAVFPSETMLTLAAQPWLGNARELRNVVEHTLALGQPPHPLPRLRTEALAGALEPLLPLTYQEARRALLDEFERRYVARLLERCDHSVRRAAREARMDRSYLTELVRRHGLR